MDRSSNIDGKNQPFLQLSVIFRRIRNRRLIHPVVQRLRMLLHGFIETGCRFPIQKPEGVNAPFGIDMECHRINEARAFCLFFQPAHLQSAPACQNELCAPFRTETWRILYFHTIAYMSTTRVRCPEDKVLITHKTQKKPAMRTLKCT